MTGGPSGRTIAIKDDPPGTVNSPNWQVLSNWPNWPVENPSQLANWQAITLYFFCSFCLRSATTARILSGERTIDNE
jgi:hypothetical protein